MSQSTTAPVELPAPTPSAAGEGAAPGYTGVRGGFPVEVDAAAHLGRRPAGPEFMYADSIYVTGRVSAAGGEFAFLVHMLELPNQGVYRQTVSVTDKVGDTYRSHTAMVPAEDVSWAGGGLDLRTPELTWTGDAHRQEVTATAPWGALDVDLVVEGPVLHYGGTASWTMLGNRQYQYAFPQIAASGTLTPDGVVHEVTGASWLDRQWGPLPDLTANRWSWMNFVLPGGDKLTVWDIRPVADIGSGSGFAWAQLLHPDGSQELAAMVPLADDAGGPWTSPESGQTYPTQFVVRVPAFDATLSVAATSPAQELPAPMGASLYEGAARFTGTYRGVDVTGDIYIEHVGSWRA